MNYRSATLQGPNGLQALKNVAIAVIDLLSFSPGLMNRRYPYSGTKSNCTTAKRRSEKKIALLLAAVVLAILGVVLVRYAEADDTPGGVVTGWLLVVGGLGLWVILRRCGFWGLRLVSDCS